MERIAIYGKGGVGKSVIATALSAYYGRTGRKVLHIGCDPKHDSAVRLVENGASIPTVLDVLSKDSNLASAQGLLHVGRHGIVCCEAGGPEPGVGCGGRGVARTLEFLDDMEVIESGGYDVVIFDVLGDVVCGGFAAPLRQSFAEKVLIVMSEEPMALYAANNISKAIKTYHRNGVHMGGFIANLKSGEADRDMLERFAARLGSRVLTFVPRDQLILSAERQRQTIVDYAPDSEPSRVLGALAEEILQLDTSGLALPTPMGDEEFFSFIKES